MSVSAVIGRKVTVKETLTVGVDDVSSNSPLLHNGFDNADQTLDANSTPAATKYSGDNIPLSTGAYTIDLTALAGANGAAVDLTGIKPIAIVFRNRGAAAMKITKGASNGYTGFDGSGTFCVSVPAGMEMTIEPIAGASVTLPAAIDSSHKTLDVTGTGSQTFDLAVLGGS